MARKLTFEQQADAVKARISPPHRIGAILFCWNVTLVTGWLGSRMLWFLLNDPLMNLHPFRPVALLLLSLVALAALSGLAGQLTAVTVTFERLAILIEPRMMGLRVRRRWYGADQIHELRFAWISSGSRLYFRVARNTRIDIAGNLDENEAERLLAAVRELGVSYAAGSESVEQIDIREFS